MRELAVTVIGHDRPGIIADIAAVLARLKVNLTDSTMTLLRGHFAMMLVCQGESDADEVARQLAPIASDGELMVSVREVAPEPEGLPAGHRHVLTVHGADRLGIVAALTRVIADAGGNVTDLTTRLTGDLYVLVAEVDLPPDVDSGGVAERLAAAAGRLGVEAGLRPAEADLL